MMPALQVLVCVIYLRVSTEEQARKGFSLPEQRELCLKRANDIAAELRKAGGLVELQTVVFEDTGGGDLIQRPVLEQVREFVLSAHPQFFICLDPDRFSRSLKWQLLVADEIEGQGTKLEFVQQEYDAADPMSRAFFQFRGIMSELEKAKILERTTRGSRGKLKSGKLARPDRTYGYVYNKASANLDIVAEEARWVRQVFTWTAGGSVPSEIVDKLNTMGVPSKMGTRWYSSTIRQMIRNTTYIGLKQCNRWNCEGLTAQAQLPKAKRTVMLTPKERPTAEWIVVSVPAIIDANLWEAVQVRLAGHKRQAQHRGTELLSGLIRCGLCGDVVHYITNVTNAGYVLRCINRYPLSRESKRPRTRCAQPHVKAKLIERQVWAEIESWLTEPEVLIARLERQRDKTVPDDQIAHLEAEIKTLREELDARRREQGQTLSITARLRLDPAVGEAALAALQEQIESLTDMLQTAEGRLDALAQAAGSSQLLLNHLRSIRDSLGPETSEVRWLLSILPANDRRALVRLMIREVTILPGRRCEPQPLLPVRHSGKNT